MRSAESILLAFFAFLTGLACWRSLPQRRRAAAVAIGILGMVVIAAAQRLSQLATPLAASVAHDWLPSPLLLLVYWQAGRFFVRPNESLQNRLIGIDRRLVDPLLGWLNQGTARAWLRTYLELSYLFCYPLVPFGLATLYLLHAGRYADRFWTVVLPPTCFCYALVPFAQTLPPRALAPRSAPARGGAVRSLNLVILRHASIHANTLPSAHVAASMSTALALFWVAPAAAAAFLWVALSIAFGAVLGRYHYAADAILGAAAAVAVFSAESILFPAR